MLDTNCRVGNLIIFESKSIFYIIANGSD